MKDQQPKIAFFVLALMVLAAPAACGPPAYKAASVKHGSLKLHEHVWVMELSGTPTQRGDAAGQLVGDQIRWLLPRYLKKTLGSKKPSQQLIQAVKKLEPSIPKAHLEQLEALAKAAQVDRDTLLAVNLAPELFAGLACSCLAVDQAKSKDSTVYLARNLDWHGGSLLTSLGLVVIEPGAQRRIASITWPGLVGVVSGMNDSGLSIANLVVFGQHQGVKAETPILFAMRSVLESAENVSAAVQKLSVIKRSVCQNFAIADSKTAAVLETCPGKARLRKTKDGFVAVANRLNEDKRTRPKSRFAKMRKAALTGKHDIDSLKKILASVALGQLNVQAVVFTPKNLRVELATEDIPAAEGPWRGLDLGPWLVKK
jgi:isopenicillin-N N-acyltransferase like protein